MHRFAQRLAGTFIAATFALSATACFEIEQTIELQRDLSGTAGVKIGVDLEPMITIMTMVQRQMEGKKGPPSAEELAAAKADFKKQSDSKPKEPIEVTRKDVEGQLPEGIKLLDVSVKEQEFGIVSSFRFAFDRLSRLPELKLPSKGDDPTKKNVLDTPFEGLEVIDKGTTITIQTKPQNPTDTVKEEAKQGPPTDPETEKMMQEAFKKLRVGYRITAPFEIVSHNATRKEGNTLIWDFDLQYFEKMAKSKKPEDMQVTVTYKK